jgi:hypothetical protein
MLGVCEPVAVQSRQPIETPRRRALSTQPSLNLGTKRDLPSLSDAHAMVGKDETS